MIDDSGLTRLLNSWGLSLSDIARAAGIPISQLRRYRHGVVTELPDEANEKIRELDAWAFNAQDAGEDEPAGLLEGRLVSGHPVVGWDLYLNGEPDALLRIAAGESAIEVLDDTFRDWRTRFSGRFSPSCNFDTGEHLLVRR